MEIIGMDKFEYMCISTGGYTDNQIIKMLNKFGEDGWELISTTAFDGKFILKRKKLTTKF